MAPFRRTHALEFRTAFLRPGCPGPVRARSALFHIWSEGGGAPRCEILRASRVEFTQPTEEGPRRRHVSPGNSI